MTRDEMEKLQELITGWKETWKRLNSEMKESKIWSNDFEKRIKSDKETELKLAALWGKTQGISAAMGQIEKFMEGISAKE